MRINSSKAFQEVQQINKEKNSIVWTLSFIMAEITGVTSQAGTHNWHNKKAEWESVCVWWLLPYFNNSEHSSLIHSRMWICEKSFSKLSFQTANRFWSTGVTHAKVMSHKYCDSNTCWSQLHPAVEKTHSFSKSHYQSFLWLRSEWSKAGSEQDEKKRNGGRDGVIVREMVVGRLSGWSWMYWLLHSCQLYLHGSQRLRLWELCL